ncbi:hypothetical protein CHS0354_023945 [Potamilus streckersoni]|uniref:ornithine carbamoyltransferase n=1 Tax=Potamilus streckersoni TaxID=2493646 RepID=A0AAE0RZY4_9BIVA|nr:hypothetical protein CHS0354_023945 [Potamilus streckersoni]
MIEDTLKQSFAKDVTLLKKIGIHVIIVHGGGKEITKIADAFGIETKFINGMRYTDSSMIHAVVMGLTMLNKQISSYISQNLGNAIGLCGGDSNLLLTHPIDRETLGYVGKVKHVNVPLIEKLIASDMIPVIAPFGIGEDKKFYNINADLAASAIATALKAEKLVYLSDIEGVQDGKELIPTLTRTIVKKLFEENKVSGGMIPKIESAFEALSKGVNLSNTQLNDILDLAIDLKAKRLQGLNEKSILGKSVALIFQKPSLRTRVSFEVAVNELGGFPIVLAQESIGIAQRESAHDIANTLFGYVHFIVARVFNHRILEDFTAEATCPIINALSDLNHPCQVLADLLTLKEKGKLFQNVKIAYIGDGNNVANSWLEAASIFSMDLNIICPNGYEPNLDFLKLAQTNKQTHVSVSNNLNLANSADVLYTDVWTSMGNENETAQRQKIFRNFQLNADLVKKAKKDALIMHCLPAHIGEEITEEVLYSSQSVVFRQAENRLHVQKALLTMLNKWNYKN